MTKKLIFVFGTLLGLILFFQANSHAEEGHHSLGAQAGEVALAGDVGNVYGNALGFGVFFDYAASDFLEFELSWLSSHHTGSSNGNLNMNQNAYALALQYNIDTFDIFTPYLKGGAEFVSHTQDVVNPSNLTVASYSTTGFGLDIGVGAKIDLAKNVMAGLDIMYHSIFDATVTPPGSLTAVNVVQNYTTVMLRLAYSFGGK